MHKPSYLLGIILCSILLSGCLPKSVTTPPAPSPSTSTSTPVVSPALTPEKSDYEKVCSWVDESDVIVKVNLGDEAVVDNSYEAGFMYYKQGSTLGLIQARLARQVCDYKTGFSFDELKGKGTVQIVVTGYSDNRRRQLDQDPISVILDENGHPSIGNLIEVTVLD